MKITLHGVNFFLEFELFGTRHVQSRNLCQLLTKYEYRNRDKWNFNGGYIAIGFCPSLRMYKLMNDALDGERP